jgi:hypothetical protein
MRSGAGATTRRCGRRAGERCARRSWPRRADRSPRTPAREGAAAVEGLEQGDAEAELVGAGVGGAAEVQLGGHVGRGAAAAGVGGLGAVDELVVVGGVGGQDLLAVAAARPKSTTRARPSSSMMTLVGVKSRWTTPSRWAAARPWPAATNTARISGQVRTCPESQVRRVTPRMNSMAMNRSPSTSPTSNTRTTLGWERRAMVVASRRRRRPRGVLAAGQDLERDAAVELGVVRRHGPRRSRRDRPGRALCSGRRPSRRQAQAPHAARVSSISRRSPAGLRGGGQRRQGAGPVVVDCPGGVVEAQMGAALRYRRC